MDITLISPEDSVLKASAFLGLALVLVLAIKSLTSDPYGTFHLGLNKLPSDEADDRPPKTEWLNMGYWKNTNVFPEACQALALKLVKASKCQPGGSVLDVGHGSGDSLLLLLAHPQAPRPRSLTGITSLPVHHHRALERIANLGLSDMTSLYLGDAVRRPSTTGHPLDPASTKTFDTILALDCAYHFNTRNEFLRQCRGRLNPGGHIALADIICRQPWSLLSRWNRLVLSALQVMPRANCVSLEEYEARLREMGYIDIEAEDITQDAFPKFLIFLKSRGIGWYIFARVFELVVPSLQFVMISAAQPL